MLDNKEVIKQKIKEANSQLDSIKTPFLWAARILSFVSSVLMFEVMFIFISFLRGKGIVSRNGIDVLFSILLFSVVAVFFLSWIVVSFDKLLMNLPICKNRTKPIIDDIAELRRSLASVEAEEGSGDVVVKR